MCLHSFIWVVWLQLLLVSLVNIYLRRPLRYWSIRNHSAGFALLAVYQYSYPPPPVLLPHIFIQIVKSMCSFFQVSFFLFRHEREAEEAQWRKTVACSLNLWWVKNCSVKGNPLKLPSMVITSISWYWMITMWICNICIVLYLPLNMLKGWLTFF